MVGWTQARPKRVLAAVLVLALLGAGLALWRLSPSASTDTLVGSGSDAGRATEVVHERFGDDAVYVLVRGDLARMVLTADLNKLLGLEGCLSGNVPAGATPPGGASSPCAELARTKPVRVVYGPGTFINSSVSEITTQLQARTRSRAAQADRANEAARKLALSQGRSEAEAKRLGAQAEKLVYAEFAKELLTLNAKYGLNLTGAPKVNDPDFVYQLVFDPARGARVPKARFAYLFPSADAALVSVRLKAGLSDAQRARAVALVRSAVAMDEWRLDGGGRYVVTGVPVLAGDITDVLAASTLRLLLVAVAVMALVLALLFRARLRLLPLGLALCAAAIVFGGLAALGLAAHDGLDRGAARAAGVGGRLQRPVPGAGGLGGLAGDGRAGHVRGLPRAAALAGADGARVRRAARGRRGAVSGGGAHGGDRGADAGRPPAGVGLRGVTVVAGRGDSSTRPARARAASCADSRRPRRPGRARPASPGPTGVASPGPPARLARVPRPAPPATPRPAAPPPRPRHPRCRASPRARPRRRGSPSPSAAGRWTRGSRSSPTCRGSSRRSSAPCATSMPCSATRASPARSTCSWKAPT